MSVGVKEIIFRHCFIFQFAGITKRLECLYDQILDILFYIFVLNRSFLNILPNFNLLRTLQRALFGPFISEISAPPLIFFVPILC